jgi:hypothetical protein
VRLLDGQQQRLGAVHLLDSVLHGLGLPRGVV